MWHSLDSTYLTKQSLQRIQKEKYTLFFLKELFYKNFEAQILSQNFSKTKKNLKLEYENFPNESLGQVKHFKHVFGVGIG